MSEPLTAEEFEKVKNRKPEELGGNLIWVAMEDRNRLIATVELQKSDKALGSALVRKIQEIKEENAKLKADITLQLSMESLRKHGLKLKVELDAALKRIEEMEPKGGDVTGPDKATTVLVPLDAKLPYKML